MTVADLTPPRLLRAVPARPTQQPAPPTPAPRPEEQAVVLVEPERFVTIPMFSSISGYTQKAIRNKIGAGVWLERREWIRTPDGRIFIDRKGVAAWQMCGA